MSSNPPFYYVTIDPETRIIQSWYQLYQPASAENFAQISEEDYQRLFSLPGAKLTAGGLVEEYTPPVVPVPLKAQAATALQQARSAVYNNYGILNEPTPDAWVAYLRALMAIENGTDTTSTALPTAPASTAE